MGIYFIQGLLILGIVVCSSLARALECGGAPGDLKRLDTEVTYANKSLLDLPRLAGVWKFSTIDENNAILTNTIELRMIDGLLQSRLVQWGAGRFTSDFSPVNVNASKALLEVDYAWSALKIQLRPIAGTKMRYAFSDGCAINFPDPYSPVFIRK